MSHHPTPLSTGRRPPTRYQLTKFGKFVTCGGLRLGPKTRCQPATTTTTQPERLSGRGTLVGSLNSFARPKKRALVLTGLNATLLEVFPSDDSPPKSPDHPPQSFRILKGCALRLNLQRGAQDASGGEANGKNACSGAERG